MYCKDGHIVPKYKYCYHLILNWKFITNGHLGNIYSLTNKYQEGPGFVEVNIHYEHSLNEVLTGYCDCNADPQGRPRENHRPVESY